MRPRAAAGLALLAAVLASAALAHVASAASPPAAACPPGTTQCGPAACTWGLCLDGGVCADPFGNAMPCMTPFPVGGGYAGGSFPQPAGGVGASAAAGAGPFGGAMFPPGFAAGGLCGGKCAAGEFCDASGSCRPDDCASQHKYGCSDDASTLQRVACPAGQGFTECYTSKGFLCFKGPSAQRVECTSQNGGGSASSSSYAAGGDSSPTAGAGNAGAGGSASATASRGTVGSSESAAADGPSPPAGAGGSSVERGAPKGAETVTTGATDGADGLPLPPLSMIDTASGALGTRGLDNSAARVTSDAQQAQPIWGAPRGYVGSWGGAWSGPGAFFPPAWSYYLPFGGMQGERLDGFCFVFGLGVYVAVFLRVGEDEGWL